MSTTENNYVNRQPFDLPDVLSERVDNLDLRDALNSMQSNGYCIIPDIATEEFTARMRAITCKLVNSITLGTHNTNTAPLLLGRDSIYEEALLNPKVQAMAEVMCGKGALLSQCIGILRPEGAPSLGLHSDQNWLPAPFPVHNQITTMCWAMDEYSEQAGATMVVPGSHLLRRHPTPDEAEAKEDAIAITCPANSLVIWDGSVWHGNYPRNITGERVTVHISFSRLHLRPVENYDRLDDNWLADRPEAFRVMLGREDFLGTTTIMAGGADYEKTRKTVRWVRE